MSKLNDEITDAFYAGELIAKNNTMVTRDGQYIKLYLHGSEIARRFGRLVAVNLQGHVTNTTIRRLNGILLPVGGRIWQQNKVVYCSGPATDGMQVMPHRSWVLLAAGTPSEHMASIMDLDAFLSR